MFQLLFHWGILTLKDDAQFVCYRAKLRVTQHQNFSHVIPNFASIMFYDMELDLNKYSNSKEKISFQIFWKTSILEGYEDDFCAIFYISICCPKVAQVFSSKLSLVWSIGNLIILYSIFVYQMSIFEGYRAFA